MLRIKKEVDLKELEKFGFQKDEYGDYFKDCKIKLASLFNNTTKVSIMIDLTSHIGRIGFVCDGKYCLDYELDLLYDLIDAGLVEKVEE